LIRGIVAAVLAAILTSACSATAGTASSPRQGVIGANDTGVAKARADSARRPYTAADIHFMSAMIGHHAQAMVMSKLAPSRGASAAVRTLAERIMNGQEDEIASMQQWLRDRHQPVPEARPGPMKMTMGGMEHEMSMPGMLTEAQMRQLEQARGAEFDRLFLTFMVQHHRGAVSMVETLFATFGAGQDHTVFKLASDVNVDQVTEIARMEKMLTELR
jgi:uncharacterized protein (DUF305 family)